MSGDLSPETPCPAKPSPPAFITPVSLDDEVFHGRALDDRDAVIPLDSDPPPGSSVATNEMPDWDSILRPPEGRPHVLPELADREAIPSPRPVQIDYRPTGLIVLHPNQRIEIEAQGVIFDVDETILEGTGEHVHDGPQARFAKAIAELLRAQGKDFDLGLWDKNYRPHTGLAETAVCDRLALQVLTDYEVVISPRDLQDLSNRLVDERFLEFMERVSLVENVHGLIDRISDADLRLAVCTASSQRFIGRALEHFGLFSKFAAHVFEATKRIGESLFSEVPVRDACRRLNLAPQTCVMIGDSISDFGAAASGDTPLELVVLRLPAAGRDQALRKFQEQRDNALAKNGDALSRTVVVVVNDYDQVRISYSPQARVSYRVPPVEDKTDA